jgi:hypothetical protein
MKFKRITSSFNKPIDIYELKMYKTQFEMLSASINNIIFDTDAESLRRLDILKNSTEDINFKDHNNETVTISPSTMSNYVDQLKIKLSSRYTKINTLYNNIKANENFTLKETISAFESLDI